MQTAMCIPKSKLLCDRFPPISSTFREFPRLSANFCDFPRLSATFREFLRLSATFRQFPRLSAPFAGAAETYPAIFRRISANFPQFSANSRSAVCTACPDPPILVFFDFLAFFDFPFSLLFLRFCFLSKDFRGSAKRETLVFFGEKPLLSPKKQGLEGQGGHGRTAQWSLLCTVAAHQVKGVAVVLMSGQVKGLPQQQSRWLMQCEQEMQCTTTIK